MADPRVQMAEPVDYEAALETRNLKAELVEAAQSGDMDKFREKVAETGKVAQKKAAERKGTPLEEDVWCYRGAIIVLGFAVAAAIVGAIVLAALSVKTPELLVAIGSAAVGAIAGLVAPKTSK